MLQALLDDVQKKLRGHFRIRGRIEGMAQDGWVLADYGDVIVHLFSPDRRSYYRLEELWNQGKVLLHLQ